MTKIAYKINTTNPNLPHGFVVDHFETDQDTVEGYAVTNKDSFDQLLKNNVTLMRMHEVNNGISGAHPYQPAHPQRPNHEAEPADTNIITARQKAIEEHQKTMQQDKEDAKLFQEFLAWKRSQKQDS